MTRVTNRQLGHVGNLGDMVKHAALVWIAEHFARNSTPVSFVDTHAFQLDAPLPDPARWEREVAPLVVRQAAYGKYAEIERAVLARNGRYRCSAGLVIDALGDRRACAVLGESNAASRAELATRIAEERLADVHVVDNAARVDDDERVPDGGALLVHVDPFRFSAALWEEISPVLSAMSARSATSVFILYRFSRNASAAWPAAPTRTTGPIATMRAGPHEVAAYASTDVGAEIRAICASLGWRATA